MSDGWWMNQILVIAGVFLFAVGTVQAEVLYVNGGCGDNSWPGVNPCCVGSDGLKKMSQVGIDGYVVLAPNYI